MIIGRIFANIWAVVFARIKKCDIIMGVSGPVAQLA